MMPFERIDAELLRTRYEREGFYCGEWIGGCGRRLYTRIGKIRVPHFAHTPDNQDPVSCRRVTTNEKSADHLYIRRDLSTWIKQQGRQTGEITINGRLPAEGGVCTGLTIPVGDQHVIAVSIRDGFGRDARDKWKKRDRELRQSSQHVDWLFAEDLPVNHVYDERGYVLRIKCETVGLDRIIKIGTQTRGRITHWSDLSECKMAENGLWTPHIERAQQRGEPRRKAPTPESSKPVEKTRPDASSPEVKSSSAAIFDFPGFPIIADDIVVIPHMQSTHPFRDVLRRTNAYAIFVTIQDGVNSHNGLQVKAIFPQQVSDIRPANPHRLIPPCLVNGSPSMSNNQISWTIYAHGLEPIDFHPVDIEAQSARTTGATEQTASGIPVEASTHPTGGDLPRSHIEPFFEQLSKAQEDGDILKCDQLKSGARRRPDPHRRLPPR